MSKGVFRGVYKPPSGHWTLTIVNMDGSVTTTDTDDVIEGEWTVVPEGEISVRNSARADIPSGRQNTAE